LANSKNIDLELLRTFIAVVDNGSITRACAQIHRSQSAISMQIKRLEQQVEHDLFDRKGRSLVLTYQGKSLVAYARRLLNLHDEAFNQFMPNRAAKNIIIGCPDDYSTSLLPKLMAVLHQHNPTLHISIITANSGELRRMMDKGEIDLALLTRLPQSNEGILIHQTKGAWLSNDTETFNQRPLPLVLVEPSCKFHSSVIDALEKDNIDYQLLCDASQISLLLTLIRQGQVVGVLPDLVVPSDLMKSLDINNLPELPIAEVILCLKGAEQNIAGLSLAQLAKLMR